MALRISTIMGANVGFEVFTTQDFESAGIDYKFGLMLNLLFVRIYMSY